MLNQKLFTIFLLLFFLSSAISRVNGQTYDATIGSLNMTDKEYSIMPIHHSDSLVFSATTTNIGTDTITGIKVKVTVSSFSDSMEFSAISPGLSKSGTMSAGYTPQNTGTYKASFSTRINENEKTLSNNVGTINFEISDTVFARDFGSTTGGLGFDNGSGYIGQKFDFRADDTITSLSIYINTPEPGDTFKAHLHSWNGSPGNILASTDAVTMVAGKYWYTIPFNCPVIVSKGAYFASVEQTMVANNIGVGYETSNKYDSTVYYDGGAGWTPADALPDPLNLAVLLIRVNVGLFDKNTEISILTSKDTVCSERILNVEADSSALKYRWSSSSAPASSQLKKTSFFFKESSTIYLEADFGCGFKDYDTVDITVSPAPYGQISADTTICNGESVTLTASGGTSYRWIGGPTNNSWKVTPTEKTSVYQLRIDSTGECFSILSTTVTLSEAEIKVEGDTSVCVNDEVMISVNGTEEIKWQDGDTNKTRLIRVLHPQYYSVIGTNQYGCTAEDSILLSVLPSPVTTLPTDTGGCLGATVVLKAGTVADSYDWSTGETSSSTSVRVLKNTQVYLETKNTNGCSFKDTVNIVRYPNPRSSINEDTTICEGSTISISASGGNRYEWNTGDTTADITVAPLVQTTYNVDIVNEFKCKTNEEIKISIAPLPSSLFSVNQFEDSVVFVNLSTNANTFSWDFGDGNSSTLESPFNIYDSTDTYTVTLTSTNDCGDDDTSIAINVKVPVIVNNVNDIIYLGNVVIYPNPVADDLYYAFNNKVKGTVEVHLYNQLGNLVYSEIANKSTPRFNGFINLNEFPKGIYYLKISMENSSHSEAVIKL